MYRYRCKHMYIYNKYVHTSDINLYIYIYICIALGSVVKYCRIASPIVSSMQTDAPDVLNMTPRPNKYILRLQSLNIMFWGPKTENMVWGLTN